MKRGGVVCAALLAVVLGHLVLSCDGSQRWWSLGFNTCATNYGNCSNCADTQVFDSNQENLCSEHGETEVVRAMSRGILECIRDCQRQFSNSQWNCTTFNGDHLFGRFIESATRETAMLNAFLSAGATHGIASACHKSTIDGCPCITKQGRREDGTTYIQKCNDNVDFAVEFMKDLYGIEDSHAEEDMVNKWNNELGYQAVSNRSNNCRCTGLSGSCVVQTCYEKAPSVDEIGSKLRIKYEGSQKVESCNHTLCIYGNHNRAPINSFPVFLNNTPDLCSASTEFGILGTKGRVCNPSSSGSNSCSRLCCNKGYERVQYTLPNEKCKFVWCCRIECVQLEPIAVTEYLCL